MPSLRGHMIFMAHLAAELPRHLPDLARAVDANWASALLGSEAPDAWYFISGAKRPDMHIVDTEDPQTWAGAIDAWLAGHPEVSPGRAQAAAVAAFVAGYLSHMGMDIWAEQYQHPGLPVAARKSAPATWFPQALSDARRLQAALRALAEAPMPQDRMVTAAQLERASVPPRFPEAEIRRVACGIAPALPLRDAWEISRVNPLREMKTGAEERARWAEQRGALPGATPAEYQALLSAATDFTLAAIRRWW